MTTTHEAPSRPPAQPATAAPLAEDLLGLSRERLAEVLASVVDKPFRVRQIHQALYERGARDFAEMTDLSKELRARLAERFRIGLPAVASRHESSDGTCKYLFRLHDGAPVEAVGIPDEGRPTFCLSSQAPAPSASRATGELGATSRPARSWPRCWPSAPTAGCRPRG